MSPKPASFKIFFIKKAERGLFCELKINRQSRFHVPLAGGTPADVSVMPPMDPVRHAGLSGVEAARAMTLPKGFRATLAAAEPDVVRPIAFALDDRGRLYVAGGVNEGRALATLEIYDFKRRRWTRFSRTWNGAWMRRS